MTTLSQSNLRYTVKVVGVVDLAGNPLAGPSPLTDPTIAVFQGIDAGPDAPDEDEDGLSDAVEQRGWFVQVKQANGNVVRYLATSNPRVADTDGDGLDDLLEQEIASNPRVADTDGDTLGDNQEFNEAYSDASSQDSDGDGLDDGAEFSFFRTSPIQADTDGDQLLDGDEVALTIRNPLVADLPKPAIEVGEIDLRLDVRFTEETAEGKRELKSKTVSSTLEQSQSRETSTSDSNTREVFASASVEVSDRHGFSLGSDAGGGAGYKNELTVTVGVESGWTGTWTHESTSTSGSEMRRAYEDSLQSDVELTTGSTETREVVGARMSAAVTLRDAGGIAFNIRNLQLTAFTSDPRDPTRLAPVATLQPDAEPDGGFYLGPLQGMRGPIIFSNDTIFPSLVEKLMARPSGIVFRISNFDIVDELGRNFAFTAQDVVDRTAAVVIDNGTVDGDGDGVGDLTEYHRVATGTGRVIDTNDDGIIDDKDEDGKADPLPTATPVPTGSGTPLPTPGGAASPTPTAAEAKDHRVVFDANGKQVGITLRSALASIGLTHYDEEATATGTLSRAERLSSYSTKKGLDGVLRIYRVRDVELEPAPTSTPRPGSSPGPTPRPSRTPDPACSPIKFDLVDPKRSWSLVTSTGLDHSRGIDTVFLTPREDVKLAFVQDADHDALESRVEYLFNCSDRLADTDDDILDDRFETLIGWDVSIAARGSYRVYSSCSLKDSDGDGLTDDEEAPDVRPLTLDVDGDCIPDVIDQERVDDEMDPPPTDPAKADTDDDGVDDKLEVKGYCVFMAGDCHKVTRDGEVVDAGPKWIGPAPNPDMLPNESDLSDEAIGACTRHQAFEALMDASDAVTDPTDPDTDDDGASDGLERLLGGDPTSADDKECFGDDDGDGLSNEQERAGWEVTIYSRSFYPLTCDQKCNQGTAFTELVKSDQKKADTDGDGLSDAEEYDLRTNPNSPDADNDGIFDFDEVRGFSLHGGDTIFTDPHDADTDDDKRIDGLEAGLVAVSQYGRWIVRPSGKAPYEVFSSPLDPDADFDRLVDGDEYAIFTDPSKSNTDGDLRDDFVEVERGTNPLVPDFMVTIDWEKIKVSNWEPLSGGGCDDLRPAAVVCNGFFCPRLYDLPDLRFDLGVVRDRTFISSITSAAGLGLDDCSSFPLSIALGEGEVPCVITDPTGNYVEVTDILSLKGRSTTFGMTDFDSWSFGGKIADVDDSNALLDDQLDLTAEGIFLELKTGTTYSMIGDAHVNQFSGAELHNGTIFFKISKTNACKMDITGAITVVGKQDSLP